MNVKYNIIDNVKAIDSIIDPNKNFDIIKRNLSIGGIDSYIYYVDRTPK